LHLPSLREIRETALAVRDAAHEERSLLAERKAAAIPSDEVLGALAVELAFDWSWINRRELCLEFVEDTTVRRTTRLHFTLPASMRTHVAPGAHIVVPLEILRKGEVLLHAEVRDQSGALLSPLNKINNGRLAGLGLAAFFRSRMGGAFPDQADELMAVVAAKDGPEADEALKALLALPGFRQYVELDQQREVEGNLVKHDLKDGFLYAVILEYRPSVPFVLEYGYDARQCWRATKTDRLDRALVAVGALPKRWPFPPEPIGRGLSNHIEVVAPVDVDIAEGRIETEQINTALGALAMSARPVDKASRSRAQFFVPLLAGDEGASNPAELSQKRARGRADQATVTVWLKPRASAALLPVFFSSLLTTVTLAFFWFSALSPRRTDRRGGPARHPGADRRLPRPTGRTSVHDPVAGRRTTAGRHGSGVRVRGRVDDRRRGVHRAIGPNGNSRHAPQRVGRHPSRPHRASRRPPRPPRLEVRRRSPHADQASW
jgi:hypothetical protein